MKQVLIVKTSSMGDILHALPALTDALAAYPDIQFDWVIEPGFAEIPRWHPAVRHIIQAPIRRWRKNIWQCLREKEWQPFFQQLRATKYDVVLDAQGLLKSAWIALFAKGTRVGLNASSARGKWVSVSYHRTCAVSLQQHAVNRARQLFALALNYPLPDSVPNYGLIPNFSTTNSIYGEKTVIFLHGTTWATKHWPQRYWQELALLAAQSGYTVLLPWGNPMEQQRAENIRSFVASQWEKNLPVVLPKLSLGEIAVLMKGVKGIVAVDTGLAHMAAALSVPTVSLYGPTDPALTGAVGDSQHHLQAKLPCVPCLRRECRLPTTSSLVSPPCFETIGADKVWEHLRSLMKKEISLIQKQLVEEFHAVVT